MTPSKNRILGSPEFQISNFFEFLGISSQLSPILWRIYEGKWHPPKYGFWGVSTGSGTAIHGQAWASTGWAPANFGEFSDFGRLESDITDFVKNLWRELTHSKIWILGSENGSSTAIHGQAWASRGWARASTSKFWNFPILGVSSQISPILWRIYKGKWHFPKIGFQDSKIASRDAEV